MVSSVQYSPVMFIVCSALCSFSILFIVNGVQCLMYSTPCAVCTDV